MHTLLLVCRDGIKRAQAQLQAFQQKAPAYNSSLFQGKGIVIMAGGLTYFVPAWINVHMLRKAGMQNSFFACLEGLPAQNVPTRFTMFHKRYGFTKVLTGIARETDSGQWHGMQCTAGACREHRQPHALLLSDSFGHKAINAVPQLRRVIPQLIGSRLMLHHVYGHID